MRAAVAALFRRCGFDVVGFPRDRVELAEVVGHAAPTVAVLALPVPGADGFTAVRDLSRSAPRCSVVVLSSFSGLRGAALEAGARAFVGEDDLRALQTILVDLACAAAHHTGGMLPAQGTRVTSLTTVSLPVVDGETAGTVSTNPWS